MTPSSRRPMFRPQPIRRPSPPRRARAVLAHLRAVLASARPEYPHPYDNRPAPGPGSTPRSPR